MSWKMETTLRQKDLERRVTILEGALGIDLDSSSSCSGDPLDCDADPCTRERCPMANSYVQQLLGHSTVVNSQIALLMAFLEELEDQDIVPNGFVRLAKARVNSDEKHTRTIEAQQRYHEAEDPTVKNALGAQLEIVRSEQTHAVDEYLRRLQEVKDALQANKNGD